MPGERFDAIIVGAGAAGLSLACHLADSGWGDKVLVVDDADQPLEQKSWAWWSRGDGLLDAAASAVIGTLRVAGATWQRDLAIAPYSYRRITGPELSAATDRFIAERPGYERLSGSVTAIAQDSTGARLVIEVPHDGHRRTVEVAARWVFDSVGPGEPSRGSGTRAYLDFHGLYIDCPTDVFDTGTATLMDFRTDQSAGTAFVYVLPLTARSALVERTVFAFSDRYDRTRQATLQESRVRQYLREHVRAGAYRVTGHEVGIIPLERGPVAKPSGWIVPIGARAGMVKASTGYGFERIQRHSAAIASCVASGRHPASAARECHWARTLDHALLRVMHADPAQAPDIFATLFARNPAPRVLSFLDEDASWRDQLKLCATMPRAPFVRAQVRAATSTRVAGPRVPHAESDKVSLPSR
nr:FAD-dependent oxidoreductase [Demequina sp. TTPB684]